jgi:transposase
VLERSSHGSPCRPQYLVGIDVGSTQCSYSLLRPDKTPVGKPTTCANTAVGFAALVTQLETLAVPAEQILIGLEAEMAALVRQDAGAAALTGVPEFGPKTVAVLRAELGDVERFAPSDQAVAYAGLDVTVRQSGTWRGQRKVSKRGSGAVRRILYMAAVHGLSQEGSAFRGYYAHLVERGVAKMSALMAVMRKMLGVAYRLLRDGSGYDPTKV